MPSSRLGDSRILPRIRFLGLDFGSPLSPLLLPVIFLLLSPHSHTLAQTRDISLPTPSPLQIILSINTSRMASSKMLSSFLQSSANPLIRPARSSSPRLFLSYIHYIPSPQGLSSVTKNNALQVSPHCAVFKSAQFMLIVIFHQGISRGLT